jgi:hypothetical protein
MKLSLKALAVVFFATGILSAQEYRATLVGTVTDPSGASVPIAKVTATNIETGVSSSSETGADGNFVIPFLVPGNYSLQYIKEHHKFQVKFSAFNAFNTPLWPAPNTTPSSPLFGMTTLVQNNLARNAEVGFRYAF